MRKTVLGDGFFYAAKPLNTADCTVFLEADSQESPACACTHGTQPQGAGAHSLRFHLPAGSIRFHTQGAEPRPFAKKPAIPHSLRSG